MPNQGGDEEPDLNQNEERQAGDEGYLPEVRHQGVPNRERLNNKAFNTWLT